MKNFTLVKLIKNLSGAEANLSPDLKWKILLKFTHGVVDNQKTLRLIFCLFPGITRWIKIPGCIKFSITTNACRGYCLSYSVPSGSETLNINPKQVITSVGQCCNIMETEDVSFFPPLSHTHFLPAQSRKVEALKELVREKKKCTRSDESI